MICREQCLRRRWGGEGKGGEREEAGGEGEGQRTGRGAHRIGEEMEKKKGRGREETRRKWEKGRMQEEEVRIISRDERGRREERKGNGRWGLKGFYLGERMGEEEGKMEGGGRRIGDLG